ncbi:protein kinase domain-containing protein [Kordiimonas laminariae]|uniref:protein kinase domain-containing protein n=1 Tax=Kordiimonas laminariae TaxID=2917717 RepID=UPI001FF465DA|nr:winged helix-turn-helix domain-containing protein [Kordiimonas laminariae]MCK0070241.1 winged helix-turn-helix domain-containing protein [Kordiimonas laminariae]
MSYQFMADVEYLYRFGSAEFDETSFTLKVGGETKRVERKPLELLALLLRHTDEVMTKEELLSTIWADQITVENVLANAIAKLRKALGKENAAQLKTQARIGYRFTGSVERIAAGRKKASALKLKVGEALSGRPHYILTEQLSTTPGREVWLARHQKTGEKRVFKFSSDGLGLASLKREVTLFRMLQKELGDNGNYVKLYDWNFETTPFFIESEYAGVSLKDWAIRTDQLKALSEDEKVSLVAKIAQTVADAHAIGILHKDLKPANILIDEKDGKPSPKLVDFGSGGLTDRDKISNIDITMLGLTIDEATSSDTTSGTPLYIAPEVLSGQSPTTKSDVYALGVLLYQVWIGNLRKPLVPGWENDISDEQIKADISTAANGNPTERLSSAATLAERLRTLQDRREQAIVNAEKLKEVETAERITRRAKARRPWLITTAAAMLFGIAASMIFGLSEQKAQESEKQQRLQALKTYFIDLARTLAS